MKKRTKVLSVVLAVAMAFTMMTALVGCDTQASGEKVLTVNTMFGTGDSHEATFLRTNNKFMEDNGAKIKNFSGIATDQNWLTGFASDMNSTNNQPDVVFYFSGAQMDKFRDKVVTVDEIKAAYPDFIKNITVKDNDAASIEMKTGVQSIMYNSGAYAEADFATYETMMAKIATNMGYDDKKAAVSADLPHYWFNHMLVRQLGIDEYKNFNGTKAYLDETGRRAKWEKAFLDTLLEMRKIGFVDTGATNGTEASSFYGGTRGIAIDGQWVAGNVNDAQKAEATKDKIKFAAFPKLGDKTYAIGGVTNGWYITKKAWDNPVKRDLAVKYIMAHSTDAVLNDYCGAGGGLPANGKVVTPETYGGKGFTSTLNKASEVLIAIDDRISAAAKAAIMGDWSTSKAFPKLITQAAAPTAAEVNAIFADFYKALV